VCRTKPEHKGRWSLKTHLMKVHNLDMLPSCTKCVVPYVREQWDDISKHYISDHGGKDEDSVLWLLVPCKQPGESYLDINHTPLCYVPLAVEGEVCDVTQVVDMGKKKERPWLESQPTTSESPVAKGKGKGKGKSTRRTTSVTPPRTVIVEEEDVESVHTPRPTVGHKTPKRRTSISPRKVDPASVRDVHSEDSDEATALDGRKLVSEMHYPRVHLSRVDQPGTKFSPIPSTSSAQVSADEVLSEEQEQLCQETARELHCTTREVRTWLQVSIRMRSQSPRGLARELQRHGLYQVREQSADTDTKIETFQILMPR
jgi:hypothetical protein